MYTIGGAKRTQEAAIFAGKPSPISHTIQLFTDWSLLKELCSITASLCVNKLMKSMMKSYYKVFKSQRFSPFLQAWLFLWLFLKRATICPSEFNTTTALFRHREAKHHIDAHSVTFLPFYNGQEVIRLPSRIRRGWRSSSYKQGISGIVDSINSCLPVHPKAAGKYACIYFPSVSPIFTTESQNFCGNGVTTFYYHYLTSLDWETSKLANRIEAVNCFVLKNQWCYQRKWWI